MTDLLEQGSNWLENQRVQHASQTVVYQRGEQSVEVAATIGKTEFEVDDGHGILQRVESRDYLILSADLVVGGQTTLPERGDRVRETQSEKVFVYEVIAPGGEPAWRYSDPYRKTLRIHSKHVATEDA